MRPICRRAQRTRNFIIIPPRWIQLDRVKIYTRISIPAVELCVLVNLLRAAVFDMIWICFADTSLAVKLFAHSSLST